MPSLDEMWEAGFALLESFVTEHGRLPRQFCKDPVEQSIGSWMKGQRRSAKAGRLTVGRIARLRALPVQGALDGKPERDRIGELAAFVAEHGRLPKSTAPDGSDELRLGEFLVRKLRPQLKAGELSRADASRAARIPGAVLFTYRPDQDERLEQVRAFIAANGHIPRYSSAPGVPAEEVRLAQWVNNTLAKPDGLREETAARVASLRELLAGSVTHNVFRAGRFLDLAEDHLAEHGTLPPATALGSPQRQTYAWLQNRRTNGDADTYGPEAASRIRALLEHPFPREAGWESRFAELNAYIAKHGKLPTGFQDGPLYRWLANQRAANRRNKLPLLRQERLRAIGAIPPRGPGRPRKPTTGK
jgi:hypothetical protein